MVHISTTRPAGRRPAIIAFATAVALGCGGAFMGSLAMADSDTTITKINPFEINGGFTILSRGDASLSNGELEGSVAAFGSISTEKGSPFQLMQETAGQGDFTVPLIDGTPVRILAASLGTGSFEVSNEGAGSNTPESKAVVKLVNTDGLSIADRGFARLQRVADQNYIDLKAAPVTSEVSNYKTEQATVEAYFTGLESTIASTNTCMSAMYAEDSVTANEVTVEPSGNMVTLSGFDADKPNYVNYSDLVDENGNPLVVKLAESYVPSAAAPFVVRVEAGTTTLGKIGVEGWSSDKNAQQGYSSYILVDASAVSGSLKIAGLEMGAVWAPNADLSYGSDTTTNGQYLSKSFTSSGGGEIHQHTFKASLLCATSSPTEEPSTAAPTTDAPTTDAPTTDAPTTDAPTTDAPTTDAPTTDAPTTDAPTTDAPTTDAPTTDAPTTDAPTTDAPTTDAPTTNAPTSDDPTTGTPVTTSPTTDKPKDKLPNTGANVGNMAIAGVILLLGGTALFVRSRKES